MIRESVSLFYGVFLLFLYVLCSSLYYVMVLLVLLLLFMCYVSLLDLCIVVWDKCASAM